MTKRNKHNRLQRVLLGIFGIRRGKRGIGLFSIDKRQKFVIAVLFLSTGLFLAELNKLSVTNSGFFAVMILAVFTSIFLFWAIHTDIKENKTYQSLILPFFYTLAFGLFYFLTPTLVLSRIIMIAVYAFGLYSLFLSQNILVVSSMRTIALLSGARIVSFVITLISYFFLANIIFSLHMNVLFVIFFVFLCTYALSYGSLWTYNLQKTIPYVHTWVFAITFCLVEVATVLWFWPSSPTVIALFLAGFFYTIVGLAHMWFERRLFKGILWEYVWVSCITFFVLILFTPWGK